MYTGRMTYDTIPGLRESIAPALDEKRPVITTTEPVIRLPGWATKLAGGLATLAGAAYGFLPHPWSSVAGIVALVAAFLALAPAPAIRFSKPLVPAALVPLLLAAAEAGQLLAASLPSPFAQSAVMLGAALLAALAGKTLPTRVTTR